MKALLNTLVICTLVLATSSCATVKNAEIRNLLSHSNCNQRNVYNYTEADLPTPLHLQQLSEALQHKLSYNSLNMANAIGLIPTLEKYIQLKTQPKQDAEYRLSILELKQDMDHKINMSSLEISAISSEMDCEEERTSQIANYLSGRADNRESKLTIAAIVVGAAGAILTGGVIKNETAANATGISTGIAEASFGFLMFFNKESIEFHHKRNALKDIWFGASNPEIFPPAVWYYLNYANPEDGVQHSLREQIIDKWTHLGQIEKDSKSELEQLYFGEGGKYSSEQLNNRADMYDQLESNINLMKQDLKALSLELDRF